jgi:hypothetical protein
MSKVLAAIMLLAVVATPGTAQGTAQDWRTQLKSDFVVIRGGKMSYDKVGLYKLNVPGYQPAQVQVKVHSEAPQTGPVSRDNFVALTTLMVSMTFVTALSESYKVPASQFLQGLEYTDLNSTIGTPDLELNLIVTNEGLQLEITNTSSGQKHRETMTWDQVFAK